MFGTGTVTPAIGFGDKFRLTRYFSVLILCDGGEQHDVSEIRVKCGEEREGRQLEF